MTKLKRNLAFSDTGFVFDPSTGDSFSSNPIGVEIIKLLKENRGESEIKSHILNLYSIDEVTFEKDLYDFINTLKKYKLTDGDEKKEA